LSVLQIKAVPGNCGDCKFWSSSRVEKVEAEGEEEAGPVVDLSKKRKKKFEEIEIGQCRWRPPAVAGEDCLAYWPETEETEWCGQFEAAVYLEFDDETTPAEEESGK
jgi:hypothetical protein